MSSIRFICLNYVYKHGGENLVLVRWFGHACFEIVTSDGLSIVIDPHDGRSIGIKPPQTHADIVLITHDHFDHNAYSVVAKPEAEVIHMFVGEREVRGIKIRGVEAYHDTVKGRRRGRVILYRIEVEGLSFVHLGDLGHIPEEEQASKLKPIDILFIPVGGTFTIDADGAWKTIDVLTPRVVIPMHYWIPGLNLPLRPVDDFVSKAPSTWRVERVDRNYIELKREALPDKTIIVLSPQT